MRDNGGQPKLSKKDCVWKLASFFLTVQTREEVADGINEPKSDRNLGHDERSTLNLSM